MNTGKLIAPRRWAQVSVFILSFLFIAILQTIYADFRLDGVHFQPWNSDRMQQTLPYEQLKQTPLQSLYYLHIQPPLLDAFRSIFAQLTPETTGEALINGADWWFLRFYWIVFGLLSVLIFSWVDRIAGIGLACLAVIFWIFNPGPIFYSTLLEGTLLSALVVTWFYYELWKVLKKQPGGSLYRVCIALTVACLTRTIFQWFFFIGFIPCMFMIGVDKKQFLKAMLIPMIIFGGFLVKQRVLFGTVSSTTFSGVQMVQMLWLYPDPEELDEIRTGLNYTYPADAEKYSGRDPWNTQNQVYENLIYQKYLPRWILSNPHIFLWRILRSIKYNSPRSNTNNPLAYWDPSYKYSSNELTDRLPWPEYYASFFHKQWYPVWLLLLFGLFLYRNRADWKKKETLLPSLGYFGIYFYAILITYLCNRYTWSEAVRLKFIIEPVLFVFICIQFRVLFLNLFARLASVLPGTISLPNNLNLNKRP